MSIFLLSPILGIGANFKWFFFLFSLNTVFHGANCVFSHFKYVLSMCGVVDGYGKQSKTTTTKAKLSEKKLTKKKCFTSSNINHTNTTMIVNILMMMKRPEMRRKKISSLKKHHIFKPCIKLMSALLFKGKEKSGMRRITDRFKHPIHAILSKLLMRA